MVTAIVTRGVVLTVPCVAVTVRGALRGEPFAVFWLATGGLNACGEFLAGLIEAAVKAND